MGYNFREILKHRRAPLVVSLAIFAGTLFAIFGIFHIVQGQRDFEMQRWQARLNDRGETAAKAVGEWLALREKVLVGASGNPTIQIYLSELALAGFDASKVQANDTKRGYVASYIGALGSRPPFATSDGGGVGLFSADGHPIASSSGFAPRLDDYRAESGKPRGLTMSLGEGGAFGFVAPVRAIQAPQPSASAVGYLVAKATLDDTLLSQLKRPADAGGGVWLIRKEDDKIWELDLAGASNWQLLDPTQVRYQAIAKMTGAPGTLQSVEGLQSGGALLLSVDVPDSDLAVVAHVPQATALAGVTEHLRGLLLNLLFALLALIALVYALFRVSAANEAAREQERKIKIYWALADLLLDVIDQRNPGASAHSRRVSKLAEGLMRASGAREVDAEVAQIAGAFLNVGKLFVPSEVLAKSGTLDGEERARILEGNRKWLDLLASVSVDLPVVPVLLEAHRLMEKQLEASEQVLLAARAVVVANGYVALTSPRTYRDAKSREEALALMRSDKAMDAQLVNSLAASDAM